MLTLFKHITESGANATDQKSEKRNILLTNYVSLVASAALLLIIFFKTIFYRQPLADSLLLFIGSLILILPILLNQFGFIRASRVWLCWMPFAFLFFGTIVGLKQEVKIDPTGYLTVRFFFLAFGCFPFLVFNAKRTGLMIAGLTAPVLSILLYDPILNFFNVGYFQKGMTGDAYEFNTARVFISFLIIGVSCYFLKRLVEEAEECNERLVKELAARNQQLQESAAQEVSLLNQQLRVNLQQLSERELWFRTLFNSAHDAIFLMENDRFIDCNEATLKIFRCERHEIIGQTPLRFSPEFQVNGSTSLRAALRRIHAALNGTPQTFEWIHLRLDGTAFDAEVSLNRVVLDHEVFLQAIVRDITARKQAEDVIRKKNEELLKINAELDRFVYSASHDLRAPISSLLGLIQVARLENSMEGMRHLLDLQEKSLTRLDRFIRDIVDYSRNTRLQIDSTQIDFPKIIDNIFEQLHFMDNVESIRKEVSVAIHGEFFSDQKRLEIIFNNLISNAIKYADVRKESPFIEIRIQGDSEGVDIIVRDNGEGIKSESVDKIFNMFYRASEKSSGSGIGLYIVGEAIQKLGGTITVESNFGEGTRFKLNIPGTKVAQLKMSLS